MKSFLRGFAKALPPKMVTNEDLSRLMDTSDEWILQRTGIKTRYWVEPPYTASTLGIDACAATLKLCSYTASDVDAVIAATTTPDFSFPGIAVQIQDKLQLGPVAAYDIRDQCAGFLYAVEMADSLVRTERYRRILVVGAEVQSTGLDLSTRGRDMAVLFGDGAGSCIVEGSSAEHSAAVPSFEVIATELHSDGSCLEDLWCKNPGSNSYPYRVQQSMIDDGTIFPKMNGRRVFENAVKRMTEVSRSILARNGIEAGDIALVVAHQANLRINQAVGEHLGIDPTRVYNTIQNYGNTTAASIPIGMSDAIGENRIRRGDLVLTPAFGSGYVWGAALLRVI